MRQLLYGLNTIILLILVSCASSNEITKQRFDSEDVTTYHTELADTGIHFESGLTVSGRILYQLRARCEGAECTPEEVVLSFFLDSGSSTIYLADRNLTLEADGKRYEWEKMDWMDIRNSPPVMGKIISVDLDLQQLETIAQAPKVTGSLASVTFEWGYERRQALRKLLNQMQGMTEPQD